MTPIRDRALALKVTIEAAPIGSVIGMENLVAFCDFISAARNDAPGILQELVEENDRLKAEKDELRKAATAMADTLWQEAFDGVGGMIRHEETIDEALSEYLAEMASEDVANAVNAWRTPNA